MTDEQIAAKQRDIIARIELSTGRKLMPSEVTHALQQARENGELPMPELQPSWPNF